MSLAQTLWGSIGWSVGAMFGAAMAARERKDEGRTILFVGDGALQLTLQEIGTVLRQGLTPYIFVINNDGYEVERQIHGVRSSHCRPTGADLDLTYLPPLSVRSLRSTTTSSFTTTRSCSISSPAGPRRARRRSTPSTGSSRGPSSMRCWMTRPLPRRTSAG